jgi:hypothetical protein
VNPPARNLRLVRPGERPPAELAAPFPDRPRTSWTAAELLAASFPEPRWAVPGVICEGVSILAGPPKVGKSWLSFGLALAVASGGKAFDAIGVTAGPVLYLALEDTPRRLQSRMRRMLSGQPAPARLTIATECPPLPDGGTVAITGWLRRNPDARLIVIDVLAKVRGRAAAGLSAYEADYAAIGHAKAIADGHGVALVLVHHVRKAASDDYLSEVSGTNGLAGAADATLVLKRQRGQADAMLYVTGRDVDESEYALRFVPDSGAWCLMDGPAQDYALTDTRAAILRYLRENPGATPKAITEATGLNTDNVKKTCQRMAADGQLISDAAGRYRPAASGGDTGNDPGTVPGVPGVPELPLTCINDFDHGGQPGNSAVLGVPGPALTCETSPEAAPVQGGITTDDSPSR